VTDSGLRDQAVAELLLTTLSGVQMAKKYGTPDWTRWGPGHFTNARGYLGQLAEPANQTLAAGAAVELEKTTASGHDMVRTHGADWSKWPAGHWTAGLGLLAQVSDPPDPYPTPTAHYTGGDFDQFLKGLKANAVAAVGADATLGQPINGYASAVTLIPADPSAPPTVSGRLDLRGNISGWLFDTLILRDDAAGSNPSWTVGGQQIVFRRCDASNSHTKIGFIFINDPTYGSAHGCQLDRVHIHDVGTMPPTNLQHGVYDMSTGLHLVDCLIERCADRGLQLRGSTGASAEYVTVRDCGEGVIFGEKSATGSAVSKSILQDNQVKSRFLIEEYDPDNSDEDNAVADCFAWNADGRGVVGSLKSVTVTDLHHEDPKLLPDGTADPSGPAAGYGCRVTLP
jgi:hypothetical protein